jgi:hypothetical protein
MIDRACGVAAPADRQDPLGRAVEHVDRKNSAPHGGATEPERTMVRIALAPHGGGASLRRRGVAYCAEVD